jgi:hypothetical protein
VQPALVVRPRAPPLPALPPGTDPGDHPLGRDLLDVPGVESLPTMYTSGEHLMCTKEKPEPPASREEYILQIAAAHTSLEMLVRQIDSTNRGSGVWPEINRMLVRLDDLRAALYATKLRKLQEKR